VASATFDAVVEILIRRRTKDQNWDIKAARQAKQIYALFARYLDEVHGVKKLSALQQKYLAAFAHSIDISDSCSNCSSLRRPKVSRSIGV
jgi:hypothetical protein